MEPAEGAEAEVFVFSAENAATKAAWVANLSALIDTLRAAGMMACSKPAQWNAYFRTLFLFLLCARARNNDKSTKSPANCSC